MKNLIFTFAFLALSQGGTFAHHASDLNFCQRSESVKKHHLHISSADA